MRTKSKSIYIPSAFRAILALGVICVSTVSAAIPTVNSIVNPSFETGNFAGWQTFGSGYGSFSVRTNGYNSQLGFFSVTPTEGNYVATTAFDGAARTIRIFQDVTIPCGAATLSFDYRCGWKLNHPEFPDSTLPRIFYVAFEPSGGGSILQSNLVLSLEPNTRNVDSGPQTMSLDASAFQGNSVRISFNFLIPEVNTGPAFAQIDNVKLLTEENQPPTDISLGNNSVNENQPVGKVVGTFEGHDPNSNEKFTYSLVSGFGDSDNASFTIDGSELKTAAIFDYETKTSYTIRVRAYDYCGTFVEKPFTISIENLVAVPGVYHGLFSESTGIDFKSSGYITVKVSQTLRSSGKLLVDGNAISFIGVMNEDGGLSVVTKRRNRATDKPELTVNIALDTPASAGMTGTILQGGISPWSSEVLANRVTWTTVPAQQATNYSHDYTMIVPGGEDGPMGTGYGLISVKTSGKMRLSGRVADGQIARQATFVSKDGYVPLFTPLYKEPYINQLGNTISRSRGFTMGWLQFTNDNGVGNLAPVGELHWIKTGWNNSTYTTGFTNTTEVTGSRWVAPLAFSGVRALDMTNVLLSFEGGDLNGSFDATYFLTKDTVLTQIKPVMAGDYPHNLKGELGLRTRKGLVTGLFSHPGFPGLPTRYFGALLQDQNYGEGFFMGPTVGGKVELQSAD